MLIVLPILLLIGIPLFLVSLRFLRPKTGILWLISALTALAVWIMLMIFRLKIPDSATFGLGKSLSFSFITTFLLDKISWPYAWALIASLLAMILTSVVYRSVEDSPSPNWTIWPQGSLLAGLGLSAIFAGNLYTLILSWTAIDLFLLYLMVTNLNSTQDALVSFAIRVAGTFVAIGAILANSQGTPISLPLVNQNVNTLVFIGSLIRLGSIGVSWKARQLSIPQQGMKSFINLVLVTSVLVVITRGSSSGISSNLIPIFLVIISIVAMIFGIMAYLTIKEMWWRFYWIMGFSAISIVAAIQGEVEASLAWGVALLLPGSLILYYYARMRSIYVFLFFGILGISALPFTPAWLGIRIYPIPGQMMEQSIWWLMILLAQSFLTACFILVTIHQRQALGGAERWVWIVYPLGLIFLVVTQYTILIFGIPGLSNDLLAFPSLIFSWINLAVIALTIGVMWTIHRANQSLSRLYLHLARITPYAWCERAYQVIFIIIRRFLQFIDQILEGKGGILWTLLFLLLLIALLIQFTARG